MNPEFALIGEKLGHSYSKEIHEAFGFYSYALKELKKEELGDFLKGGAFRGLNVTIPYKQAVMPYCAELSERAKRIGSVNTVVRRADGTLFGDNTDYAGFLSMSQSAGISFAGKKALIFGSGGTSKTVKCAVEDRGGSAVVISRSGPEDYEHLDRHADAQLLINTTPLGMFPNTQASPADPGRFPRCEGVLDVIYNPLRTQFLLAAESLGIPCSGGLRMLVQQARHSAELFSGQQISEEKAEEVYAALLRKMRNIVLIGMPGSGKTGLGKKVAHLSGREFYDTDTLIEQKAGKTVEEIFAQEGEERFRAMETEVLQEVCKKSGAVIATGGGAVLREENRSAIRANSFAVYIERDLGLLATRGRPLSAGKGALQKLYAARRALYLKCADAVVKNNGGFLAAAHKILEAADENPGD